jgi:hypothetical protein
MLADQDRAIVLKCQRTRPERHQRGSRGPRDWTNGPFELDP